MIVFSGYYDADVCAREHAEVIRSVTQGNGRYRRVGPFVSIRIDKSPDGCRFVGIAHDMQKATSAYASQPVAARRLLEAVTVIFGIQPKHWFRAEALICEARLFLRQARFANYSRKAQFEERFALTIKLGLDLSVRGLNRLAPDGNGLSQVRFPEISRRYVNSGAIFRDRRMSKFEFILIIVELGESLAADEHQRNAPPLERIQRWLRRPPVISIVIKQRTVEIAEHEDPVFCWG